MPHSITRLALPMLGLCVAAFAAPAFAQTTLDKIRLYAVSESHQLIAVSAAEPQKITRSVTLYGLAPNERILGIDYRVVGQPMVVSTASGTANAWRVKFDRVKIGSLEVLGVDGVVVQGSAPTEVLLGMSFLSRVSWREEQGMLVLESKF